MHDSIPWIAPVPAVGVTQEALAEGLQVSRQTIISLERGRYDPSIRLALFVILAASIPAVRSVSSTALAVATVLGTTAVYRIGALILKRLP